ncbi:MAG: hypothetical protein ACOYMB_02635 [Patescibacteria group bacterium]
MGEKPGSTKKLKEFYSETVSKGPATKAGKQRVESGKGLHEYVDPKGNGVIRRSISWLEPDENGNFYLFRGTAMLIETRLDTTGSMGNNVEIAMKVLPQTINLLKEVPKAVLDRYDVHIITAIFGDVKDRFILCRSQAEFDERIAQQMTHFFPEGGGGDLPEDPQFGLFGAAYLTAATIKELGLKSYDFTITDDLGRDYVSMANLERVFGSEVLSKTAENGWPIDAKQLPSTKEIVIDLLKTTHAFVLLVGPEDHVIHYWEGIYGPDRVVILPETELLPEVQAAIIGLTEGTLTLETVEEFLVKQAGLEASVAAKIKRAVAGIPIGAQMMQENFDRIPMKGDKFLNKRDLWPIKDEEKTE